MMTPHPNDHHISKPSRKKKDRVVELVEVDGKKVSKTSTGKRKFHNKSKNGCDNCKRRRVKCDELKPTCQKCINMNLECVYSMPKPRKAKGSSTSVRYVTHKQMTSEDDEQGQDGEESMHSSSTRNNSLSDSNGLNPNNNNNNVSISEIQQQTIARLQQQQQMQQQQLQQQLEQLQQLKQLQQQNVMNSTTTTPFPISPVRQSEPSPINTGSNGIDGLLLPPLIAGTSNKQQSPPSLLKNLSNSGFDLTNSPGMLSFSGSNMSIGLANLINPNKMASFSQFNPASLNNGALSQLSKLGLNIGSMLPPNIDISSLVSNITSGSGFDLNALLGTKVNPNSTRAVKASTAEEALANMQEHQEQITNQDNTNTNVPNTTPLLNNNPTMLPSMTPTVRATSLTVESNDNNDPSLSQSASDSPSSTTASSSLSASSPSSSHGRSSSSTNVGDSTDSKPLIPKLLQLSPKVNLNLVELKLFHHYCTKVWPTIISAGISGPDVWGTYIPELAFDYPFLMHSLLAFSATHLSRTESGLDNYVSSHRLDALKLLREAVLNISDENTDALVASALILIMDSLANSSSSSPTNVNTMSPSAWIFHVKGAVTILTAVWPLPAKSKFVDLISVDLSDLGDVFNREDGTISELVCFDETISDLYPVEIDSPYLITLAYLDKLHREKNQLDFILRVFAFPALLDKTFLALLMTGDLGAMRIMRSYYKLLRGFTTEVKDKVWFLEGVSQALPSDVDSYSGGGQHMMLDFLGGGLPSMTMTNLSELL